MKIWEWNEKEYFLITLTEEQAYEKIKEYYKKEGFKGEINFVKYTYSVPDGYGFTDEYGNMKIQFIDKVKILNQEHKRIKEVQANDIDFSRALEIIRRDSSKMCLLEKTVDTCEKNRRELFILNTVDAWGK